MLQRVERVGRGRAVLVLVGREHTELGDDSLMNEQAVPVETERVRIGSWRMR